MEVIGFGALNFDRLFKVDRIAHGGEETHILEDYYGPGGSAANTICGLAKLGTKTGFMGAVGSDAEGQTILEDFKKLGVDVTGIRVKEERTGTVFGFVDRTGERALYVLPGANSSISGDDLNWEYISRAKYVHLSSFVGEKQFEVQKELVRRMPERCRLSFAPGSIYVGRGIETLLPFIERCEVIFLTEKEITALTGKDGREGSRQLIENGCKIVAVTQGGRGSLVSTSDRTFHVKPFPSEPVDTTGAGDAFAAGFLRGLLEEKGVEKCALWGNYVASRCVRAMGAREGLPDLEELHQLEQ